MVELARRLSQFSPIHQIEARIAMLELAVEAMVDTHGGYDAAEIAAAALCKAAPGHQGDLR